MKKRLLALVLAGAMALSLVACGGGDTTTSTPPAEESKAPAVQSEAPAEATEITLWTYPIGKWGDQATVTGLTDAFTAETGIKVTVEYLDYTAGDDKVNTAISAGEAPDLVMEGPERLAANWGINGHMVDLSDMLDDEDKAELNAAALSSCYGADGKLYEYPLVMTSHCMAINKTVFEAAGAMQYIDETTRQWKSTEDFLKAVQAVYDHTGSTVGAVFCAGQGGDQGTRALYNNMYGGTFTNADYTAYTWDSPENVKALQALYDAEGISYDASIVGGDEIALFYQGVLNMAFCWNIGQQLNPNSAGTGEGKTMTGDEIMYLAFPAEAGKDPVLCGGIWGFGIFDNGDQARIDAAKEFIKYFCDSAATADAVKAANYFAARSAAEGTDLSTVWADNATMSEYNDTMVPYMGAYYPALIGGWAQARTSAWTMLQAIGAGEDIAATTAKYAAEANAAIG